MKSWTPLTPSRPGDSISSLLKATNLTSSSATAHPIRLPPPTLGAWIGPLPESLHLLIIASLPVSDLPRLAKVSRAFGRLVVSDEAWERRCKSLGLKEPESTSSKDGELASFPLPLLQEPSNLFYIHKNQGSPPYHLHVLWILPKRQLTSIVLFPSPPASSSNVNISSPSSSTAPPLPTPGFRDISSGQPSISSPPLSPPPSAHVSSHASGFGNISSHPSAQARNPPEDEFGDFVDVPIPAPSFGAPGDKSLLDFGKDFVPLPSRFGAAATGARTNGFFSFAPMMAAASASPNRPSSHLATPSVSKPPPKPKPPYRKLYQDHHLSLLPLLQPILTVPSPPLSQILSLLFPPHTSPSTQYQSKVLVQLLSFLSPSVQPISSWKAARQLILAAADRFDATCLVGFEGCDERSDEEGMTEWARAGWSVWVEAGQVGKRRRPEEWEVGRVWIERREIFYEGGAMWDPLKNIV